MNTNQKEQQAELVKELGKYPIHFESSAYNQCVKTPKARLWLNDSLEVENRKFDFVKVIPNNSKKCSKRHNSDIAVYQSSGRLPLDYTKLAIREMTLQGEI